VPKCRSAARIFEQASDLISEFHECGPPRPAQLGPYRHSVRQLRHRQERHGASAAGQAPGANRRGAGVRPLVQLLSHADPLLQEHDVTVLLNLSICDGACADKVDSFFSSAYRGPPSSASRGYGPNHHGHPAKARRHARSCGASSPAMLEARSAEKMRHRRRARAARRWARSSPGRRGRERSRREEPVMQSSRRSARRADAARVAPSSMCHGRCGPSPGPAKPTTTRRRQSRADEARPGSHVWPLRLAPARSPVAAPLLLLLRRISLQPGRRPRACRSRRLPPGALAADQACGALGRVAG
jgi:hypothetical protein